MYFSIVFFATCMVLADPNPKQWPIIIYAGGVSLVIAALGLLAQGLRQASYRAMLNQLSPGTTLRPALPAIDEVSRAWEALYLRQHDYYTAMVLQEQNLRTEQATFFTQWVHQIKTPLTVLRLLSDSRELPELRTELNRIERAVHNALGFSRLHDLAADFLVRELDWENLIHQSLEPYGPLVAEKKLAVQIQSRDVSILADSKWLLFVLDQLVSNAIKYCRQGDSLLFSLILSKELDHPLPLDFPRDCRILSVADTGPGIPAEDLARVWNRAFTGSAGRRDLSATGMGLWLARRMCQAMGIAAHIQSTQGQGTRVFLGIRA
jgi:signal transduction histidine kinase